MGRTAPSWRPCAPLPGTDVTGCAGRRWKRMLQLAHGCKELASDAREPAERRSTVSASKAAMLADTAAVRVFTTPPHAVPLGAG